MDSQDTIIKQAELFCKHDPLCFLRWSLEMKKQGITWPYDIAIKNNLIIKTEKAKRK